MKASKILLKITAFFCFVYSVIYIISLVFIPIGIYCFLAGKRFNYKSNNLNDDLIFTNKNFKGYVVFSSIFCFPFGLISIIPYYLLVSNKVKVTNLKYVDIREEEIKEEIRLGYVSNEVTKKEEQPVNKETEAEKLEKFKKLESFKEKGLITDAELEQAREQLFGKKNN